MRKNRYGTDGIAGIFAALVLVMAAGAQGATGADICDPTQYTGVKAGPWNAGYGPDDDFDNDGYTNSEECLGLTSQNAYITFAGWNGGSTSPDRKAYLDPATQDLFVIVLANTANGGSRFDRITGAGQAPGALIEILGNVGVAAHALTSAPVAVEDRAIASTQRYDVDSLANVRQKAVRITEDRNTSLGTSKSPAPFGSSQWGTPNYLDDARIYTYRVESHVNSTCNGKICKDAISGVSVAATATDRSPIIDQYVKSVAAHEIGHTNKMTAVSDPTFNGNHYSPDSKVVMSQNITWVKAGNTTVVYYIPNAYVSPNDANEKKLRGF